MVIKNTVNLCSLNVNGMHMKEKRGRVIEWIKAQKCSIVFLQETHIDEKIELQIKNETDFDIYCSHGTSASRGVAILFRKSLKYEYINKFIDNEGRFILVNAGIEDTVFSLVCIYAPNGRTLRNTFF